MPDVLSQYVLWAAIIAMLPGLWACWRKRYIAGGVLAVFGAGTLTALFAFAAVVLYPAFSFELATGIGLIAYLAIAVGILVISNDVSIDPKAPKHD